MVAPLGMSKTDEMTAPATERASFPTRVKICGITTLADARIAAEAGADFLGYNLYTKSPRYIPIPRVRDITDVLRIEFPDVEHVGVFVDVPEDAIRRALDLGALDMAQLHGSEDCAFCEKLRDRGMRHMKALHFGAEAPATRWSDFTTPEFFLCDTFDRNRAGGTGRGFDQTLLPGDLPRERMFLAGGLTPDNVAQAIAAVRPFAVDVSSGVELAPGRKSAERVQAFVQRAKAHTHNRSAGD
jgi:phosphoribosylanthranilate isomerase